MKYVAKNALKMWPKVFCMPWSLCIVMIYIEKVPASLYNCFNCDGILILQDDGPAVLDAPIQIQAEIENAKDFEGPFYFTFCKFKYSFCP